MNRADKRRQVREIDKMMKSIQSLTPTQVKAMNYVTNEKVTAVLVSYQRVINASLVEDVNQYYDIANKFLNLSTEDHLTAFEISKKAWVLSDRWANIASNAGKLALKEKGVNHGRNNYC